MVDQNIKVELYSQYKSVLLEFFKINLLDVDKGATLSTLLDELRKVEDGKYVWISDSINKHVLSDEDELITNQEVLLDFDYIKDILLDY